MYLSMLKNFITEFFINSNFKSQYYNLQSYIVFVQFFSALGRKFDYDVLPSVDETVNCVT